MVNDVKMTSSVNLRTFNGGNVRVYTDQRLINNSAIRPNDAHSKYLQAQESTAFTGYNHPERNGSSTNRMAMNNVNYEQSYPVQTSFKSPEKLVNKHVGTSSTAGPTSSLKPQCSTFKQPSSRKSSVIRIDARDYSDNAEPDLPPAAMTLPRAMNPLTNYSGTATTLPQKQSTAPGYLQRNVSKTSLYAPSSICHMIATTTPPPPAQSALDDLPDPPAYTGGSTGSPSLRRQQSQTGTGVRGTYEYTQAGDTATMRRSHPSTSENEPMYPSPFVNTLPYHTTAKAHSVIPASAQELIKECEGYNNTTYSISSKDNASSEATQHVSFAPPQYSNSDQKKARKSASFDSGKGSSKNGSRSKDSATYKYPQKSKQAIMTADEKSSRVLDKKSLWCLIVMLLILLLVAIIFLIHFATRYNNLRTKITVYESSSTVIPPTVLVPTAPPTTTTATTTTPAPTLPPKEIQKQYCLTDDCIWSAGTVLQKMNKSVDPCTDFYEYSCGGWISDNYMPADLTHYGVVSKITISNERLLYESLIRTDDSSNLGRDLRGRGLRQNKTEAERKAQDFFRSCLDLGYINMLGAQPMLEMITQIGGWSPLGNWNESKWDLDELLYVIQGQQSISVFFSMSVQPNLVNESVSILRIDQDGVTLPATDFYVNDEQTPANIKVVKAYERLISTILILLGAQDVTGTVNDIYGFEKELAKILAAQPDSSQEEGSEDNMITIEMLNKLCPKIDWFRLLQRIISKTSLSLSTEVFVLSKTFMEDLSKLLSRTPPKTLHNYMVWRAVVTKVNYLSSPFRKAMIEFSTALLGPRHRRSIWKDCILEVNKHFGVATGVMFVREAFSSKSKREVEDMVENIKVAFRLHLQEVRWMDDSTKLKAVEKLNEMTVDVGYQEDLLNDNDFLNKQYNFDVTPYTYFKNILNSIQYKISQRVDKIFSYRKMKEWTMSPQAMNAFYAPSTNRVIFPAGLLQSPLYDAKFPMAVNYGGIGSKIGHELTHGYDSLGEKYDKKGNYNPWWSTVSSSRFNQRSKCVIRQYNKYSLGDLYVSGQNTLDENIADIAGLKVAYKAYKNWKSSAKYENKLPLPGLELTDDQLFFVGFAQTWCMKRLPVSYRRQFQQDQHAPERFRVQGGVSQFKEFANAFNCPPTSPMNPPFKCLVW